jgi:integrase
MTKRFTWGEALDYTLKTRWVGKAALKTNKINTGHFTEFAGRSFPVERINQVQMDLFKAHLKEEREASNATLNRCVTAVATVINHCAKREMCKAAPVFDKEDEGERRMFWFTQEQVDEMSHAAVDPYYRKEISDIILTAAYSGMRQGELLKLKAGDIDLGQRRIHVGGVPHLTAKAKNYRAIPIHPRIFDLLCGRLEHCSPSVKVFDDVGNKDQLLLAFKKVRDYARVPEYTFHDLRHSFGTWHAIAGTPMRTLMGLMGHKRIETTLDYSKHTDKAAEAAMAAI